MVARMLIVRLAIMAAAVRMVAMLRWLWLLVASGIVMRLMTRMHIMVVVMFVFHTIVLTASKL